MSRKDKDQKRRAQLRAELRAEGLDERLIAEIVERERFDALVRRHGLHQARIIVSRDAHHADPDDTGFKPSLGDPLLRGAARAEGVTAKVVRRRNTITRFEYAREVEQGKDR